MKTIYFNDYNNDRRLSLEKSKVDVILDPQDPAAYIKWKLDPFQNKCQFIPFFRMIRYDLPETAIGRVHLQSLLDKIEPTFDVTSWEAQYCLEKGIPLLCDEARRNKLIQRPDFPNKALFMIKGAAAQGTTG